MVFDCCFLLGACLAPSALDVTDITKTSASISWTAASSYIDHVVSVDGQWEVVTRPGVNQCLITGGQADGAVASLV